MTSPDAPIVHLTGTARYEPMPGEIAAARKYVDGGGVLLVDAARHQHLEHLGVGSGLLPEVRAEPDLLDTRRAEGEH